MYPTKHQSKLLEIRFQVLCRLYNDWLANVNEEIKIAKNKAYEHNEPVTEASERRKWQTFVEFDMLQKAVEERVRYFYSMNQLFGQFDIDYEKHKNNPATWYAIGTVDAINYQQRDMLAKLKRVHKDEIGELHFRKTRHGYSYTTRYTHALAIETENGIKQHNVRDASTNAPYTQSGYGVRLWARDVGYIKALYHRDMPTGEQTTRKIEDGMVKTVTISHTNTNKWFCIFIVEFPDPMPDYAFEKRAGIDVGLVYPVATSDKQYLIEAPKWIDKQLKSINSLQRGMARSDRNMNPHAFDEKGAYIKGCKLIHSNRYEQNRRVLASKHEHLRNQRGNFWHEITDELTKTYDFIALEDLNLSLMMHNKKLARRCADVALSTFREYLQQKADERNVMVVYINPAYTSQACAECEHVEKDNRSTRDTFVCRNCGHTNHADWNAAENILARGLAEFGNACHYLYTIDKEQLKHLAKSLAANDKTWVRKHCENLLKRYKKSLNKADKLERKTQWISHWQTIYYAYQKVFN